MTKKTTRRSFLAKLGWISLGASVGAVAVGSAWYLMQSSGALSPNQQRSLGRLADFKSGDAKLFEPMDAVFVFREEQGLQAISAICTYEGCSIRPFEAANANFSEKHANCPCCGSTFSRSGLVLGGPAERPLVFFALKIVNGGELVLDYSQNDRSHPYVQQSAQGIGNDLYLNSATGQMGKGPVPK